LPPLDLPSDEEALAAEAHLDYLTRNSLYRKEK
jgi:hypothetical protein